MKKIAKLSLVTAVMVAGLTNVNAASLEESIKNVDISGQFRFRFQEKKVDKSTTTNESNSDVEIEIGVKVPVNDMVTAVFKIDNAGNHKDDADKKTKGDVEIEDYYFSFANNGLTVNAGQQNIPGRLTDAAQGDGIVALQSMGNFTVGAAAFANHNVKLSPVGIDGSQALYSVIALGNVGPVSLLGQYATVDETIDTYGVKADVAVDMVKLGLEYTASELKNDVTAVPATSRDDRSTFKAYVSAKAGIVSAKLSYAKTGDNGSGAIDSQANNDGLEAASEYLLWNLGTSNNADMDVVALDASVALTDKISFRAAFATGEIGTGTKSDVEEILGQVTYKMSKNLTSYVRYATFDNSGTSDEDGQRGRVEVKYSF